MMSCAAYDMLCGFMELIFEPFGQGNEPDTSADVSLRYFIHCVFIPHETFETRMDSIEKNIYFFVSGSACTTFIVRYQISPGLPKSAEENEKMPEVDPNVLAKLPRCPSIHHAFFHLGRQ